MKKGSRLQSYRHGLWAEYLAVGLFVLKGYRVLVRRYKCPVGEVDFIAAKRGVLVAVEVKFRRGVKGADEILETIHMKNQHRVERAMAHFLACNPRHNGKSVRFDAVAVSWPLKVYHLDNAWRARS